MELKSRTMTHTLTRPSTSTRLGLNKTNSKAPIGVITYNTTTGQLKQCAVYSTFWGKNSKPDAVNCYTFLISTGHGLIRQNTVGYTPLV